MEWQKDYSELSEAGYGVDEHMPDDLRANGWARRWQGTGRRLRQVLLAALVVLLLHVGMTNPTVKQIGTATVTLIKEVSIQIWHWGEGMVTSYGGPDLLLRQRAERVRERLTQEQAQLAEIEAQAAAAAQALDNDLRILAQNQRVARTYLRELAEMVVQNQFFGADGHALAAAAVETVIAEKVAVYTALQRQLNAMQAAQATYQATERAAHHLQETAEQQLIDLETYRTLLEGTLQLVQYDTPAQPLRAGSVGAKRRFTSTARPRAQPPSWTAALAQAVAVPPLSAAAVITLHESSNTLVADLRN
ncbi:MAG: hypothetical protein R3E79_02850 [Caldilineaceae bacterium]